MSRVLLVSLLAVTVALIVPSVAPAAYVTLSVEQLEELQQLSPDPSDGGGGTYGGTHSTLGNVVTYTLNSDPDNEAWIQVGNTFDLDPDEFLANGDWTGYDSFKLSFHNPNSETADESNIYVNSFFNTGWTDVGEDNKFYENDGTWLQPGESTILSIDLSSVQNLNHVTAWGYQAVLGGLKEDSNGYGDGWGWSTGGGEFQVGVDAVPAPGAISVWSLLVLAGLALMRWRRNR